MTRTRIKICGVRDLDTARAAVDAGADAIGLVFVAKSPRHVTLEQAHDIIQATAAMVEPVGLFVNADAKTIRGTCQTLGLRTVQLYGHESPDMIESLTPLRVIKALAFDPDTLAQRIEALPANVAAILIDSPVKENQLPGGTGQVYDWTALSELNLVDAPPLVVAGGLTPDNVAEAIRIVRPYAVDVSSGVESSRGVKDAGLIRAFCDAVHRTAR